MAGDVPFVDIFKENLFTKKRNAYGLKREIRFISERIVVEYSPDERLSVREIVHPVSPFRSPDPYFSFNLTDSPEQYVTSIDFHDHAPYFPYAKSTGEINLLRYINNFNDKNFAKISCQNIMKLPGECVDMLRNGKLDKGFMAMYYYTHGRREESTLSIVDLVDPTKNVTHFDTCQPMNDFTWTWYNEVTLAACDDQALRVIDVRTPKSYNAVFFDGGIKKIAVNAMRMGEVLGFDGNKLLLFDIRRLDVPITQRSVNFPNGDTLAEMRYNVYLPKQLFLHTTSHRLYSVNCDEMEMFTPKHLSEEVVDEEERITFKNIDRGVYTKKMREARRREFKMEPQEVSLEDYQNQYELAKIDEEVQFPVTWTDPFVYPVDDPPTEFPINTYEYNLTKLEERALGEYLYQVEPAKYLYLAENVETFDFTLPGVNGVLLVRTNELSYNLIASPLHYEGSSSSDVSIDAISEMRKVQCREMIPSHMMYLMSSRLHAGWTAFDCKEPNFQELIKTMTSNEPQFWCIWLKNSGHLQYSGGEYCTFAPKNLPTLPDVLPTYRFNKYNKVGMKDAYKDVLRITAPFYRLLLPKPVPDVNNGEALRALSSLYPVPDKPHRVDVREKCCTRHWNKFPNRVRYIKKGRVIMIGRGNKYVSMFRDFNVQVGNRKRFRKIMKKSSERAEPFPYCLWNPRSEAEKLMIEEHKAWVEERKQKRAEERKKKEEEEAARLKLMKESEPERPLTPPPPTKRMLRRGIPPPPPPPMPNQPGMPQKKKKDEVKLIISSEHRPLFRYIPKRLRERTLVQMLKKSMSKSMKVKRDEVFKSTMKRTTGLGLSSVNDQRLLDLKTALNRCKRLGWHALYQKNFLFPEKCSYDQLFACFAKLYNQISRKSKDNMICENPKNEEKKPTSKRRHSGDVKTGRWYIDKNKYDKVLDINGSSEDETSSSEEDFDADAEDSSSSDEEGPIQRVGSKPLTTVTSVCEMSSLPFQRMMQIANTKLLDAVNHSRGENHAPTSSTISDLCIIICDWKSPLITIINKFTGEVVFQQVVPIEKVQHIRTYLRFGYDEVLPKSTHSDYWTAKYFNFRNYIHPFFVYTPPYTLKPRKGSIPRIDEFRVKGMKLSDTYFKALQRTFYGRYHPLTITKESLVERSNTELPWEKTQSPSKRRHSKDMARKGSLIDQKIPVLDQPKCPTCYKKLVTTEVCFRCDKTVKMFSCTVIESMRHKFTGLERGRRVCRKCGNRKMKLRCSTFDTNKVEKKKKEVKIVDPKPVVKPPTRASRRRRSRTKSNLGIEPPTHVERDDQFVERCFENIDDKDYVDNQDPMLHFFMKRAVDYKATRNERDRKDAEMHDADLEVAIKRDSTIEEKKAAAVQADKEASSNELQHYTWTNEKTGETFVKWVTADEIYAIESRQSRYARRRAHKEAKQAAKKAAEIAAWKEKNASSSSPKKSKSKSKTPSPPKQDASLEKKRKDFVKDFDKIGRIDGSSGIQRAIMRRNIRQKFKQAKKNLQQAKPKPKPKPKPKAKPQIEQKEKVQKPIIKVVSQTSPKRVAKKFRTTLRKTRLDARRLDDDQKSCVLNSQVTKRKAKGSIGCFGEEAYRIFEEKYRRKKPVKRRKKKRSKKSKKKRKTKKTNINMSKVLNTLNRTDSEKDLIKVLKDLLKEERDDDVKQTPKIVKKRKKMKRKTGTCRLNVTWAENLTGEVVVKGRPRVRKQKAKTVQEKRIALDRTFMKSVMYHRVNEDRFRMMKGTYEPPESPKKGCFRESYVKKPEKKLSKEHLRRRMNDLRKRDELIGRKTATKPMSNIQAQWRNIKNRMAVKYFNKARIPSWRVMWKMEDMRKKEEKAKRARRAQRSKQIRLIFKKLMAKKPPVKPAPVAPAKPIRPPLSPIRHPLTLDWPVEEQGMTIGRTLTAPTTPTAAAPASPNELPAPPTTSIKESAMSMFKRTVMPFLKPVSAVFGSRRSEPPDQQSQSSQQQESQPSTSTASPPSLEARDLSMRRNTINASAAAERRKPSDPITIRPLPKGYATNGSSAEDAAEFEENEGWYGEDRSPTPKSEPEHAFSAPGPLPLSPPKPLGKKKEDDEKPLIKKTMRSATMPSLLPLLQKKKTKDNLKKKLATLTSMENAKTTVLDPKKFPSINMPTPFYIEEINRPSPSISPQTVHSIKRTRRKPSRAFKMNSRISAILKSMNSKPFTQKMLMNYLTSQSDIGDDTFTRGFIASYPFLEMTQKLQVKLHNTKMRHKFCIKDKKARNKKEIWEVLRDVFPYEEGRKGKLMRQKRGNYLKKFLSSALVKTSKNRYRKSKLWRSKRRQFRKMKKNGFKPLFRNPRFRNIDKMKPIPRRVGKAVRREPKEYNELDKLRHKNIFIRYYKFARQMCRRALNEGRRNNDWRLYHVVSDILKHRMKDFMEYKQEKYDKFKKDMQAAGVVIKAKLEEQPENRSSQPRLFGKYNLLKKARVPRKHHLPRKVMKKLNQFSTKTPQALKQPFIPDFDEETQKILLPEEDSDIDRTPPPTDTDTESEYAETDSTTSSQRENKKFWKRKSEQSTFNVKGFPGLLFLARLVQEKVGEHMEQNLKLRGPGFEHYRDKIQVSPIRRLMLISIGCRMQDRYKKRNVASSDLPQSFANMFTAMCYGHGEHLPKLVELLHRMIGYPSANYEDMDDANQSWIITKLYRKFIGVQSGYEEYDLALQTKEALEKKIERKKISSIDENEPYNITELDRVPWSFDEWMTACDQFLFFSKRSKNVHPELVACIYFLRMIMTDGYSADIVDEIIDLKLPIREKLIFIINLSPYTQILRNTLRLFQRVQGLDRLPFVGLGYHKDSLAILQEEAVLNGDCQLVAHLLVIGQCLDNKSEEELLPDVGSDHIQNRDIGGMLENMLGTFEKERGPKVLQDAFPISYVRDPQGNNINLSCAELAKLLECEVSKYLAVLEVLRGSSYLDRTCNHIDRLKKAPTFFPTELTCLHCHTPVFTGNELATYGEEITLATVSEQLISTRFEPASRSCKLNVEEEELKPYVPPVTTATDPNQTEEELQHRSSQQSCQNCRRPLPRCSICMCYYLAHLSPLEWNLRNKPVRDFAVCYLCNHGGHVKHLVEWFKTEEVCPVHKCKCKCASVQPSLLEHTQIRESMIQSSNMRARSHICNPRCATDPPFLQ